MNEIYFLRAWITAQTDRWGSKRRDERGAVEITSTVLMVAIIAVGVIAVVGVIIAKVKSRADSIELG